MSDMKNRDYLGDGVYVRWDGFALHLAANHHNNEVIVLEPLVLEALNRFYKRMK